jgi:hypothetical protein
MSSMSDISSNQDATGTCKMKHAINITHQVQVNSFNCIDCHQLRFGWITNDCLGTDIIVLHRLWRHETRKWYIEHSLISLSHIVLGKFARVPGWSLRGPVSPPNGTSRSWSINCRTKSRHHLHVKYTQYTAQLTNQANKDLSSVLRRRWPTRRYTKQINKDSSLVLWLAYDAGDQSSILGCGTLSIPSSKSSHTTQASVTDICLKRVWCLDQGQYSHRIDWSRFFNFFTKFSFQENFQEHLSFCHSCLYTI